MTTIYDTPARLGFVGGVIDRDDRVRNSPALTAAAWADPRAQLLLLDGIDPQLTDDGALAFAPLPPGADADAHALLGMIDGTPVFVALPQGEALPSAPYAPRVWQLFDRLDPPSLAHYGAARSLVDWHGRHRFCAQCGSETKPVKAGWSRACGGCGAEHFPRVDPVVIMLAEYEGRVLLGRQPRYPAGRYSALAGFLEPGESIEEAVARELYEEAGIRVSRVDYVMSQPWPFPSSLMIGCIARATGDALLIDTTELEDAFWVDEAGVRAAMRGDNGAPFLPPPPLAIAHHLLHHWLGD